MKLIIHPDCGNYFCFMDMDGHYNYDGFYRHCKFFADKDWKEYDINDMDALIQNIQDYIERRIESRMRLKNG